MARLILSQSISAENDEIRKQLKKLAASSWAKPLLAAIGKKSESTSAELLSSGSVSVTKKVMLSVVAALSSFKANAGPNFKLVGEDSAGGDDTYVIAAYEIRKPPTLTEKGIAIEKDGSSYRISFFRQSAKFRPGNFMQ